jgi:DsbC/DsbD-like thiol-disulfide interchange protein
VPTSGYLAGSMLPRRPWLLALGLLAAGPAVTCGQPAARHHVRATLVAEKDAVQPGQTLLVGFRLEMAPGWHTYWRNPGDAGLATKVRWTLPTGFAAGDLQWPRPRRFKTGPLVSYGYEKDVLLPVEIRVPAAVASSEVQLAAHLSWLECHEECLPGKADLSLRLPVRAAAIPGASAALFAAARRELPRREAGWRISASAGPNALELTVAPPRGTVVSDAYFYPATRRVLDYSQPQSLRPSGRGFRLVMARDRNGLPSIERLAGALEVTTASGVDTLEVDTPVKEQKGDP